MSYCPVRLGKGHFQPFVLWSLILKPSTALTLEGHARRHEAVSQDSKPVTSSFSPTSPSTSPKSTVSTTKPCPPWVADAVEGRGADINNDSLNSSYPIMQIDFQFTRINHFCHMTLWSFSAWKKKCCHRLDTWSRALVFRFFLLPELFSHPH